MLHTLLTFVYTLGMDYSLLPVCVSHYLQVDIEGHERFAFRRCDALLDAFYVPFIFMEWQVMLLTRNRQSEDWKLIDDLVEHLRRRGYTPFDARTRVPQRIGAWNTWAPDILWKHKLAAFN